MGRESLNVAPLRDTELRSLNAFIADLNSKLNQVSQSLARQEGIDSETPTFSNSLDLQYNRVTRVNWPEADDDVVTLGYLKEFGVHRAPGEEAYDVSYPVNYVQIVSNTQLPNWNQVLSMIRTELSTGIVLTDPTFADVTGSRTIGTVYQNTEDTYKIAQISFQVLPDEDDMLGEISVEGNTDPTEIDDTGVANKIQFLFFDTNGLSNNATPDHTNDHITITVAGTYFVGASIHAEKEAGAAATLGFEIWKNGGTVAIPNLHAHQRFAGGAGDVQAVPIMGTTTFAVNDTIELWVYNDTNTNDVTIEDCTLSLFKVGS